MRIRTRTLKFVTFIPVCILALIIINWAFFHLLNWTILRTNMWYTQLDIVFFFLLAPFFWGAIWGIFKLVTIGMAALLIPVSPDKHFSLYSLGILSLINCLVLIGYYWSREVDYSWKVILMSMIITLFIIDFSTSIVMVFSKKGALDAQE